MLSLRSAHETYGDLVVAFASVKVPDKGIFAAKTKRRTPWASTAKQEWEPRSLNPRHLCRGACQREWYVHVAPTDYYIINEDDTWTLMYFVQDMAGWDEAPDDVDTFLRTHQLILAA